jgi:hypothetical protein
MKEGRKEMKGGNEEVKGSEGSKSWVSRTEGRKEGRK